MPAYFTFRLSTLRQQISQHPRMTCVTLVIMIVIDENMGSHAMIGAADEPAPYCHRASAATVMAKYPGLWVTKKFHVLNRCELT